MGAANKMNKLQKLAVRAFLSKGWLAYKVFSLEIASQKITVK